MLKPLFNQGNLAALKAIYEYAPIEFMETISEDANDLFCLVCKNGNLEIAQWLLEIKPDIDISAKNEYAFVYACRHGCLEVAKWLLQVKPDINVSSGEEDAFCFACEKGHLEVAKWLLEVKPDIDISADSDVAFCFAASNGHLVVAQWLLQKKPSINISSRDNFAFIYACSKGHLETVKWLLEINRSITDIDIKFAFKMACERSHFDMVVFLFLEYPTLDYTNYVTDYAFCTACSHGKLEIAKWLLELNPYVNISVGEDFAFRSACSNGHLNVAMWLLEYNPNIDIHSDNGHAFMMACENNHIGVASLFVAQDPDRYVMEFSEDGVLTSYRILKKLPLDEFVCKTLGEDVDTKCPICYEATATIQTNCGHNYCDVCIRTHYNTSELCPYCRTSITMCYPLLGRL